MSGKHHAMQGGDAHTEERGSFAAIDYASAIEV